MRNAYEIRGDVTVVFIRRPSEGKILECLIDTADLPKVAGIPGSWRARWSPECRTSYAVAHLPGDRNHGFQMHRLILDAPKELEVDHRHHNGLDNRRSEIRLVTRAQNALNRRADYNSQTGHRGVYWDPRLRRYRAAVRILGKNHYLGIHRTAERASLAVQHFLVEKGI